MKTADTVKDDIFYHNIGSSSYIITDNNGRNLYFDEFVSKYKNSYIPDYLAWSFDVKTGVYDFIGNRFSYNGYHINSFKLFYSKIKPSFRSLFSDAVNGFIALLSEGTIDKNSRLSIVAPFKIGPTVYFSSKITLVACLLKGEVQGLVVTLTPVSLDDGANFKVFIVNNNTYDTVSTQLLKEYLNPPVINFTSKQRKIIELIYSGNTTTEIAKQQGKAINAVYKINRKILEKLSDYFELNFKDAREAVIFYHKSFRE